MSTSVSIPATLSSAIEFALEDLRAFADAGGLLDFDLWLSTPSDQTQADPTRCVACFAGAVLWKGRLEDHRVAPPELVSGGGEDEWEDTPMHYDDQTRPFLFALNLLRKCNLIDAYETLMAGRVVTTPGVIDKLLSVQSKYEGAIEYTPQEENRGEWFSAMASLAADLAKKGF